MARLEYARYATEFEAETGRLGAAVAALAPDAPVPTCPEWTVRDLVAHVGAGHRWSARMVAERLTAPLPVATVPAPDDPAAWPDWLGEGAEQLSGAVRAAGPDCPVWTWQPDRTAGFWLRRMLHDELVHRFDAELAAGPPGAVAPDLAADGVADLLDCAAVMSSPRAAAFPAFDGLAGNGETLLFQAIDAGLDGAEWWVERTPEGAVWRAADGPAGVTVRGPARELLLVLNRRLDPRRAGLAVTGDAMLFDDWLAHSTF